MGTLLNYPKKPSALRAGTTIGYMPLFPTLGSLQEVNDLAESRLPITSKNEVTSLLATYHNTLLHLINNPERI